MSTTWNMYIHVVMLLHFCPPFSGECLVSPQAALRVSLPVGPAIPVYSGPASVSGTLPHDLVSFDLTARSGNTVILK